MFSLYFYYFFVYVNDQINNEITISNIINILLTYKKKEKQKL